MIEPLLRQPHVCVIYSLPLPNDISHGFIMKQFATEVIYGLKASWYINLQTTATISDTVITIG